MPPIQEPGLDVEEAATESPAPDPSESAKPGEAEPEVAGEPAFELVRGILVGMVQAIEDGADLLGASIREELGRFRTDLVKSAVATWLLVAGGALLTAGLALLLHAWIGSWPAVLLGLGVAYLAVGGLLFASMRRGDRRGEGDG